MWDTKISDRPIVDEQLNEELEEEAVEEERKFYIETTRSIFEYANDDVVLTVNSNEDGVVLEQGTNEICIGDKELLNELISILIEISDSYEE